MPKKTRRLWLMYPQASVQRPIVYELGNKFDVVTNIRQASVQDDVGIVCLELEGEPEALASAIQWLEAEGVKVQPVEINVIE